jgi:clan AA aspartic protease (TIGR02281 family)
VFLGQGTRTIFLSLAVFLTLCSFPARAQADIIYLKNGRSIEGFIVRQDEGGVELDVGIGLVKFQEADIAEISIATSDEALSLKKKWRDKKNRDEKKKLEEERAPQDVALVESQGHIMVEAILNQRLRVRLLLDTGASLIVLPESVAREVGIDLDKEQSTVQLKVADGRLINATSAVLKSVSVQSSEAKDVEVAVIPDILAKSGINNGVLGMSFLKRFNFKVDYSQKKLILEKL